MTITLETLSGLNMGDDAQKVFESAFPNGCPDWMTFVAHPDCREHWKERIALKVHNLTLDERLRLVDELDDPEYWCGYIALNAPSLTLSERERLADESDDPEYWRGMISLIR